MNAEETKKLLDEGYMLLQKHTSLKSERHPDGLGTCMVGYAQIRAMYGQRRKWYVLEKGFTTPEARDKRLVALLALPKYAEHTYS